MNLSSLKNIFALKTSEDQLASTSKFANLSLTPILSQRDIAGAQFATGGPIFFEQSLAENQWCVGAAAYVTVDVTLTDGGGNQLVNADGIAPCCGAAAALFNRVIMFVNDQEVESLDSGAVSVVDQVQKRLSKSSDWLENQGQGENQYSYSFTERLHYVTGNDGADSAPKKSFSLTWRLPLSWFQNHQGQPGPVKLRLQLDPNPNASYAFIQATAAKTLNTDYLFSVDKLTCTFPVLYGPRISNQIYLQDQLRYTVNRRNITNTASLQNYSFTVPDSTFMIAVAFQDATNGTATNTGLYPPTRFHCAGSTELNVAQLWVTYNGLTRPDPSVIQISANSTDQNGQRYHLSYSTSEIHDAMQEVPSLGYESLQAYESRGPFTLMDFSTDGTMKGTNASIYFSFTGAPGANVSLLVVAISRGSVRYDVSGGYTTVKVENH